jgi:hypothetical protein
VSEIAHGEPFGDRKRCATRFPEQNQDSRVLRGAALAAGEQRRREIGIGRRPLGTPIKNGSMSSNESEARGLRRQVDVGTIMALIALAISGLSFYRSYIYTKHDLEITVTEVSYVTNQGELYMSIAFSNGGNRDAAVLRVEPAMWSADRKPDPAWVPLADRVHPNIPVTTPRTPLIVKAGGVEVVTLSAILNAAAAEQSAIASQAGTFLGIRVATMNSDGNLYLLEHAVARLEVDRNGRIQRAEPAIHQTLSGFEDLHAPPPGDKLQSNKKTPFVWADQHS